MICFQSKVPSSFPQTDSNCSSRLRIPSQLPKYCFSDTVWLLRILLQQLPGRSQASNFAESRQEMCQRWSTNLNDKCVVSTLQSAQHFWTTNQEVWWEQKWQVPKCPWPKATVPLSAKLFAVASAKYMYMLKVWAWPEAFWV